MRNINPILAITNKWKGASKEDRFAVVLFALFVAGLFFWGRRYFFFFAGAFADTWLITVIYTLIFLKKRRARLKKQMSEIAIEWYMLGISIIISFYFHFIYRRFNDFYVFYFFVLVQTISLITSGSTESEDEKKISKSIFGKVCFYVKILISSTFRSGMYIILGLSVLFAIWGLSNLNKHKNIDWNSPGIFSVQAISKIDKRLPFTFQYRIHGYLPDSSKATVGWSFNNNSPRKFKKNDTLIVYPLHNSKWKYIAAKFAELKKPTGSYKGIILDGMLVASAIFFLLWLGLMIPITYPVIDYLKNQELYKEWEKERQFVKLNAKIVDLAISIAQPLDPEKSIDREKRLLEKMPELSNDMTKEVFEYCDKLESQALNISEKIREGRKTKKMGIKELSFKFPQVKKKRLEKVIISQGA